MTLLADVGPAAAAWRAAAILALLAVAASAALAESALFGSTGRALEDGDRGEPSEREAWLLARCRPVLVSLLLISVLSLAAAALLAMPLLGAAARALGLADWFGLALFAVAGAVLWLAAGVIAPRALAARPAWAGAAVTVVYPLVRALYPLAAGLAGALDRARSRERAPAEPISAEDVRSMAGGEEGEEPFGEQEAALIHSIMEFGETTVREVMVGRVDMVALPESAGLDDALSLIRESGHSRIPIYGADLDDIRGVLHAKDLLPLAAGRGDGASDWQRFARKARFVPAGRNLDDLLADLRRHRTHMAIVVDEYGGTLGLVTLEDLLEEVVGEIRDELDEPEDEPRMVAEGPGTYRADARLDLDDFFDALGLQVDTSDFGFETVGGLVFHLAGAVPAEGHEVEFENLLLRVEALDANRIREVRVTKLHEPGEHEPRVTDP